MAKDLGYIIDYDKALKIKNYISSIFNTWGMPTQRVTKNQSTYEIWHPNLKQQFGAIYLAGKDLKTIEEKSAVKYIEVRFFVSQLKLLNRYDDFLELKQNYSSKMTVKEDSILKFQFLKPDKDLINELLLDIHKALFAFKS
ncbi:hypothetical protein ABEX78_20950 [Priestia megaterium]